MVYRLFFDRFRRLGRLAGSWLMLTLVILGAASLGFSNVALAHGPKHSEPGHTGDETVPPGATPTAGSSSPYPVRQNTPIVRAYEEHLHVAVAKSCAEPKGFQRIEIKAGHKFARAGETFGFEPRVLRVEPCQEVEVVLDNEDEVRHSFMIPGMNPMFNLEFIGPGRNIARFVAPAEDVTLAYHCHTSQHEKMGMAGWIVVGKGGMPDTEGRIAGKSFAAEGTIVDLRARENMIIIEHGDIPGLMGPMTMAFKFANPGLARGIAAGDQVQFTLLAETQTVTAIEVTGTAAPATKPTVAPTPMAPQNSADTFEATGTVIAKLAGRNQLLIDHEDIPGFMSAMTMAFTLSDPAAMETVAEGDKVRFNLDKVRGHIVRIDKAGAPTAAASNSPEPGAYPSEAITLGRDLDGDGDADEVHIRLEVVEMEQEIWPGELLNFWVFAPISKGMISNARAPSPTIRVEQGDRIRITLHNTHYLPHTIHLHGTIHPNAMDGVPAVTQKMVMPGEAFTYEFVAKNPGTHFYHCHVQPDVHVPMGLAGMLIIEPNRPDNSFSNLVIGAGEIRDIAKATAEHYDREYSMVYLDVDDRLNRIPLASTSPAEISRRMHREYDTTQRVPNIFLLNGYSFPYTLRDTPVQVKAGERVKLRVLNAGAHVMSLHTHGHRGQVTDIDGNEVPKAARQLLDVHTLTAARRVDIELRPGLDETYSSGPGVWLMHDHAEEATTNKGINPGGNVTAIIYESYMNADGTPKLAGSLARYFDPRYHRGEIPVFGAAPFEVGPRAAKATATATVVGRGHVLALEAGGHLVVLDQDAIPGMSAAEVTRHLLEDPQMAAGIPPGSAVRFTLDRASGVLLDITAVR